MLLVLGPAGAVDVDVDALAAAVANVLGANIDRIARMYAPRLKSSSSALWPLGGWLPSVAVVDVVVVVEIKSVGVCVLDSSI